MTSAASPPRPARAPQPGPQRGAHALVPVVRDDHVDRGVLGPAGLVQQGAGLLGGGAQHHGHRRAAAVQQQPDGPVQEGHAVRVAQQRLGAAHPTAGTRGEQQPRDAHEAAASMSRSARSTLPDPSATRSSSDQPRERSSSNSRG